MNILLDHLLWGFLFLALACTLFKMFDALVKAYRKWKGENLRMCFEKSMNFFSFGYDEEYERRIGIGWNHATVWFYCHGYHIGIDG